MSHARGWYSTTCNVGLRALPPRDWAAGSVVFMSLTAGGVDAILQSIDAALQAIEAEAAARQAAVTELAVSARTVDAVLISTATQAEKGKCYVLTASLTLTLPASPAAGDVVRVVNQSSTRTAVVARNGRPIMGLAEDMVIDALNASVELMYADATRGWVLI